MEEIKKKYGINEVYKIASNENLYGLPDGLAEKICCNEISIVSIIILTLTAG